jgi:hypothetical protein
MPSGNFDFIGARRGFFLHTNLGDKSLFYNDLGALFHGRYGRVLNYGFGFGVGGRGTWVPTLIRGGLTTTVPLLLLGAGGFGIRLPKCVDFACGTLMCFFSLLMRIIEVLPHKTCKADYAYDKSRSCNNA